MAVTHLPGFLRFITVVVIYTDVPKLAIILTTDGSKIRPLNTGRTCIGAIVAPLEVENVQAIGCPHTAELCHWTRRLVEEVFDAK